MRTYLLPVLAITLFIGYSTIATVTSGAASFAASPLLIAAIATMVWHDRTTEKA